MEGPRKRLVINIAGQAMSLENIETLAKAFRDAAKSIQSLDVDRDRMIRAYGQAWMELNEYGTDDEINYVRTSVKVNSKTLDSWAAVYLQGAGDDGRWSAEKIQRLRVRRQAKANETGRGALLAQHRVMSAPVEELTVTDVMYLMGYRSLNQLLGIKPTDSPRARMNEDGSPADNDLLGDDEGGSDLPRARTIRGGDGGFLDAGQGISPDSPRARRDLDGEDVPFLDDVTDQGPGEAAADAGGPGAGNPLVGDDDADDEDDGSEADWPDQRPGRLEAAGGGGGTRSLSPCVAGAPAAPTQATTRASTGLVGAAPTPPTIPNAAPWASRPMDWVPAQRQAEPLSVQATFDGLYQQAERVRRFADQVQRGEVGAEHLARVMAAIGGGQ